MRHFLSCVALKNLNRRLNMCDTTRALLFSSRQILFYSLDFHQMIEDASLIYRHWQGISKLSQIWGHKAKPVGWRLNESSAVIC